MFKSSSLQFLANQNSIPRTLAFQLLQSFEDILLASKPSLFQLQIYYLY